MAPRKTRKTKRAATRRAGKRAPVKKLAYGGNFSTQGAMNADTALGQTTVNQPVDAIGKFNDSSWGAYAGGSVGTMIGLTAVEGEDMLTDTQKVTAGYFSSGVGQINAGSIYTGSLADSNENYYFNLTQTHPLSSSVETQFSVAYGHAGGSGSQTDSGAVKGPTQSIYGQWASRLLDESEVSGGFRISSAELSANKPAGSALASGVRDEDIYVLVGKRERFKDRINKKNWTIALSGSTQGNAVNTYTGSYLLKLTDDSATSNATSTVAGNRYNIVSGSNGSVSGSGASHITYGWFYPDQGVMIFSAAQLSASIGGLIDTTSKVAVFDSTRTADNFVSCSGFAPNATAAANANNALRFVNCLQPAGSYLKFRSEEDQVSVSYFCRVRAKDLNFSNNPTFVSGSSNEISNDDMWGNPNVYITGIGLYGSGNQLVAIGKLSTPLKKNFATEATVKVKLTY